MIPETDLEIRYLETLEWMFRQLPEFNRIGPAAYKASLDNTILLCQKLGDPHLKFKSIHIAGTNGKGSCSSLLAGVLQSSGYKTGLYTSPHIADFRERIRIDGQMVSKEWVVSFIEKVRALSEQIQPSFFEITVAMAFQYFAELEVDIAVIEVGLGGLLDSTNVITPEVSVITNISLDHTNLLGSSLEEIALQKAGIMKAHVPVVVGETQDKTEGLFFAHAVKLNCPLFFADSRYSVVHTEMKDNKQFLKVVDKAMGSIFLISTDLLGQYQAKNLVTVMTVLDVLKQQGWHFPFLTYDKLFFETRHSTGFKGRYDMVHQQPAVLLDTSHNEAGIRELFQQVKKMSYNNLFIVTGFVKDKDINNILALFPQKADYFFVQADIARALPVKELQAMAGDLGLIGDACEDVSTALATAIRIAQPGDLVLVTGSFFILEQAYQYIDKNLSEKKSP